MIVRWLGARYLLHRALPSQLHVTSVRPLSTSLFRPSEAQDSQGYQNSKSKQAQINQTSEIDSTEENKRHTLPPKAKTVSQADDDLRERLEQMSGEGGAFGIEYEDGRPNAMKRGVRNNMFRLI
ncbi:unnamed protein product [Penicillium egyptiacum]|uniref:Uncharacterized protein n=1 Tax=Penicillium egyptiacum TaxID=1303716 RepID=A0A9W4KIT4_9EURO|nr:unnamed protein product [Penicillium egyptiacum]